MNFSLIYDLRVGEQGDIPAMYATLKIKFIDIRIDRLKLSHAWPNQLLCPSTVYTSLIKSDQPKCDKNSNSLSFEQCYLGHKLKPYAKYHC